MLQNLERGARQAKLPRAWDNTNTTYGVDGRVEKRKNSAILQGVRRARKKNPPPAEAQALSAAIGYQIADDLAHQKGLLFHAAALKVSGKAVLLLAPSGGGKSTVLRYCRRGRTLHDDKMAVAKEKRRWLASSVPMLDNRGKWGRPQTAPLGAVFLIEKVKEPHLIRLSPLEAFPRVAGFAIEPTGKKKNRKLVSQTLMELVCEVPVYRLGYVLGEDASGVFTACTLAACPAASEPQKAARQ